MNNNLIFNIILIILIFINYLILIFFLAKVRGKEYTNINFKKSLDIIFKTKTENDNDIIKENKTLNNKIKNLFIITASLFIGIILIIVLLRLIQNKFYNNLNNQYNINSELKSISQSLLVGNINLNTFKKQKINIIKTKHPILIAFIGGLIQYNLQFPIIIGLNLLFGILFFLYKIPNDKRLLDSIDDLFIKYKDTRDINNKNIIKEKIDNHHKIINKENKKFIIINVSIFFSIFIIITSIHLLLYLKYNNLYNIIKLQLPKIYKIIIKFIFISLLFILLQYIFYESISIHQFKFIVDNYKINRNYIYKTFFKKKQ